MKKEFKIGQFIISLLVGMAAGMLINNNFKNKLIDNESKRVNKFKSYYNLLNQWLLIKQEGKSLEQYFIDKGYKTIAIYGMGELGNRLYEELKNSVIEVKYGIDQNAGSAHSELEVVDINEELQKVDVIVVTAAFAFDEIEKQLIELVDYPIVSLEDIIFIV